MLREKIQRVFLSNRIAADCVPQMLYRTKVLNCNPLDGDLSSYDFLRALDQP